MNRALRVLPFIAILSLLLYVANLVVYEALADIFSISTVWQLWLVGVLLAALSGSFIAATLLGMRYYNLFTRLYYTASAVWIGSFLYLFFASILYGLLALVPGVPRSLGEAFFAAAAVASIYAVVHATNIRVAKVEVSLPHLPAQWHGKRALWVSDLHLGQLHGPSFARKVAAMITMIPHDIIFIGGDLFDGTGAPDVDELIAPLKSLSAPLGVYFVSGNHEEFGDGARFLAAVAALGIRVLSDELVEIDGMQLIGVDYRTASDRERFRAILAGFSIDPKKPSILLKHEPKDLDVAHGAGISLQISGHTHRAQLWPLEYVARLTYKGFVYGLKHFKEMQVFVSSGTGTWGPPMRLGTNSEIVVCTLRADSKVLDLKM